MKTILSSLILLFLLNACTPAARVRISAKRNIFRDSLLHAAHVGISVFEPAKNRYLYNYQGDKYFVPASNTKIPTCYAAMKYLGDSLVSARWAVNRNRELVILPAGDPTFLHPEYKHQPLWNLLQQHAAVQVNFSEWKSDRWGNGWSWNDYEAAYMAERSALPIYGNVVNFQLMNERLVITPSSISVFKATNDTLSGYEAESGNVASDSFSISRALDRNQFFVNPSRSRFTSASVPLRTDVNYIIKLLHDTLKGETVYAGFRGKNEEPLGWKVIRSQPLDSVLRPMMHRSDNFFAEQMLLMAAHEQTGVFDEGAFIDTLLATHFRDLPQRPRWADGSGLSRYNLFTPQDFVQILDKMKNEFGMERIKDVFPTGGEGTLSNFYKADSGFVYGKTGTLSGVVAFSGYLYTKKGRLLVFSVLVNNHRANATQVRRSVEKFLQRTRRKF
jgi:D-alanyl-D-alanine carboxypeptidase/D-alanyl-D-alanine-endopeptidase (penicillin-binding protein 4)